ncbi:TPA: SidE phosphodiesterase domain-containing protein [Legionella pneumophila]
MPKSRYESQKPAYQKHPHRSQPPMDSIAVFEWETFSPLPDYSDQRLAEVFKRISRDIIERPYHYDPHRVFDTQGNLVKYKFTRANNTNPPEKIPGVAVYKQNHGTGHALRQMIYTDALIDKIANEGNPQGQAIAQKINSNTEIKSALKLAAYCKRIGRTFDHEKDGYGHGQPSIYSRRSADMFAQIAIELGYNKDLIQIIRDSMLEPAPKDSATLNGYANVAGINGKELRYFAKNVLMSAHMADLTRIFTVKSKYIENSLKYYFDPIKLKEVSTGLIEMACKANAMTGNAVAAQEKDVKHQRKKSLDRKKLVEVVSHLDQAMDNLAKLKLSTPSVDAATPAKHHILPQRKTVFAFDVDDTLIKQHTFRVKGGPIFNKKEMSKIKMQMAEAIKNGHEVWIVTANWSYKKEQMKKLFTPDPDNLWGKIKFFNGADIGRELGIPQNKLHLVHSQGKKGEFLAKKIAHDPDLKNYKVNCVLFDDTQIQIDNCAPNSSEKIKIEGYRVDDYQALRRVRPTPIRKLSEEFADRVSKAAVVEEIAVENKYAHKAYGSPAGKYHFFATPVSAPIAADFKKRYQTLHGNHLKPKLLEDLKERAQNAPSQEKPEALKTPLMTFT